jgi:hypothetical protein
MIGLRHRGANLSEGDNMVAIGTTWRAALRKHIINQT